MRFLGATRASTDSQPLISLSCLQRSGRSCQSTTMHGSNLQLHHLVMDSMFNLHQRAPAPVQRPKGLAVGAAVPVQSTVRYPGTRFLRVPHPSMEGFPAGMQRISRSWAALALGSTSSVRGVHDLQKGQDEHCPCLCFSIEALLS